ncbi:MAG: winged helix-turn-helix domain-containing protein [Prevotella sp.]|nr:winged helix-turn-helix domain-containing protein [Prevotella sp.]
MQRTGTPVKSVEKFARMLGVPRPSLSRVLGELRREGIIERTIDGLQLKKGTKYRK